MRSASMPSRSETSCLYDVTDRKSTRLNSSHVKSSYAVFCLKKKEHGIFDDCPIQVSTRATMATRYRQPGADVDFSRSRPLLVLDAVDAVPYPEDPRARAWLV